MSSFLEEYGKSIFVLVLMAILIAFASPFGIQVKDKITDKIHTLEQIGDNEQYLQGYGRPKEPETAVDQVYCILYDDGELTISQNETTPDNNRTVLNKGYYQRPKDIDTTDGKQYIRKVRFTEAVKPKSCEKWFGSGIYETLNTDSCIYLTEIENLNYLYTNECINMNAMFYGCKTLKELDISNFNTSKVTNIGYMFAVCSSLINIDLNNFDTSNVKIMNGVFEGCTNLKTLNIINFNTSNVCNMSWMFSGCSSLTSLNVNNFNTSNVTNMRNMFNDCNKLISIDISNFNTYKVTDMNSMFCNCINLTVLNLYKFDTSNVTDMSYMFYNTKFSLLDLTSFNLSKLETSENMFQYSTISKITSTQDTYYKLYNDTTCATTYVKQWVIP